MKIVANTVSGGSTAKVAQICVDILHDGHYDEQEIANAVESLGYEVMGVDSCDVTQSYDL